MLWTVIECCIYASFMVRFLKSREKINPWLSCGIILTFNLLLKLIPAQIYIFSGASDIVRIAINFALVCILLDGSLTEKIFVSAIAETILFMTNYLILTILNNLINTEFLESIMDKETWNITAFVSNIIFVAVLCTATKLVIYMKEERQFAFHSIEWVSVAVVSYVSMFILTDVLQFSFFDFPDRTSIQIGTGIGMIVINILVFLLMHKISRTNAEKIALFIDRMQLEQYKIQLSEFEKQYEEMRQIRHDMKNHLQCISILLQENENEEALAYVNDMIQNKLNFGYAAVRTGHRIVDIIANTKLSQCRAEQIKTAVSISRFELEMDDVDICIILGNLFDNAIEACRKAEGERFVFFEAVQRKGYVNFVLRNSVSGFVLEHNPELHTTKNEKTLHGLGINSVKDTVNKYGGMISFYEKNQEFSADVWIPCQKLK